MIKLVRFILIGFFILFQLACSYIEEKSTSNAGFEEYSFSEKIRLLENRITKNPADVEAKIALENTKHQAIKKYTRIGYSALTEGNFSGALIAYKHALEFSPHNAKILKKIEFVEREQSIQNDYESAQALYSDGKYAKASVLLNTILQQHPSHEGTINLKRVIENSHSPKKISGPKVDLSFNKIDLPSALEFLSENYQFNLILDQSVKDTPVTINVKDISFYKALSLILKSTNNSYKVIDGNTLMVFADSKGNKEQYSDNVIKTFYLNNAEAKDISALLKSVLGIGQITVNESSNSITVVDSPDLMGIISDVILNNDHPKGEVFFDVEIMEVNLSNSELSGVDYGAYQISAAVPAIPLSGSIANSIKDQGSFNIPSITLSAFKQDVNAKILANPKVRVIDGEKAKIHIGERVPLRSSDILDATGQTRTTFEYQDVGIRLDVESKIHNDSQVTIKIALEVSSLGENLGNSEQQVFRIGTRNAETVMLVNDGDTAILGGLIRDESRSTNTSVPKIAKFLGVSWPFSNKDESENRSDILLTISPRIIRGKDKARTYLEKITQLNSEEYRLSKLKIKPVKTSTELQGVSEESGFNFVVANEPLIYGAQNSPTSAESLNSESINNISTTSKESSQEYGTDTSRPQVYKSDNDRTDLGEKNTFSFVESNYYAERSVDSITQLNATLDEGDLVTFDLSYNSNIVEFKQATSLESSIKVISSENLGKSGAMQVRVEKVGDDPSGEENASLELVFDSKRKGATFLVMKNISITKLSGEIIELESSNARIKVR